MKRVIGWVLLIWGIGGLLVNIVAFAVWHSPIYTVAIGALVLMPLILLGWNIIHPQRAIKEGLR